MSQSNERNLFGDVEQVVLDEQARPGAQAPVSMSKLFEPAFDSSFEVMDGKVEPEPVFINPTSDGRSRVDFKLPVRSERSEQPRTSSAKGLAAKAVTGINPVAVVAETVSSLSKVAANKSETKRDDRREMTSADRLKSDTHKHHRHIFYAGIGLTAMLAGAGVAYEGISTTGHIANRIITGVGHGLTHAWDSLVESSKPEAQITIESAITNVRLSGVKTFVESSTHGTGYLKDQEKLPFNVNDPGDWHSAKFRLKADVDTKADTSTFRFYTVKNAEGQDQAAVDVDPNTLQIDVDNQTNDVDDQGKEIKPQIKSGKTWSIDQVFSSSDHDPIADNAQKLAVIAMRTCAGPQNSLIEYGIAYQVKLDIKAGEDFLTSEHTKAGDQGAALLEALRKQPIIVRFVTQGDDGNTPPKYYDPTKPLQNVPTIPNDKQMSQLTGISEKKLSVSADPSCKLSGSAVNAFMKIIGRHDLIAETPAQP